MYLRMRGTMGGPRNKLGEIGPKVALYSGLGFILPGAIIVGVVCGYYLDGWLGTKPLMSVVLGAAGAVAGFVEIFRLLSREEQREKRNDTNDGAGSC